MAQPENGARNCSGAGSDAVAATTMVYSSAPASVERLDDLRHGRALLADGDIDAIELGLLVGAGVDGLLVDDGVDGDGGLAGLAVADDQFALAAADRDQGVDGLQAGLHRLMHRLARNDAGRLDVDAAAFGDVRSVALAVDRIAQRIDHAAEQALADRHVHDGAGALDGVAFLDGGCRCRRSRTPTLSVSRFRAMPLMPPGNSTISPAWTLSRP